MFNNKKPKLMELDTCYHNVTVKSELKAGKYLWMWSFEQEKGVQCTLGVALEFENGIERAGKIFWVAGLYMCSPYVALHRNLAMNKY